MKLDLERAARILVDAAEMGDRKAAEKWKVSQRTVENHRARLRTNPELAALFGQFAKTAQATSAVSWAADRASVLKAAAARALTLLAKEDDLDKVSRLVEKFGELELAGTLLGEGAGDRREGKAPAAASGGGDQEGGAEERATH